MRESWYVPGGGGGWGVGRRRTVVASEPGESGFIGVLTFCLQEPLLCPSQELEAEQICEHKSAPPTHALDSLQPDLSEVLVLMHCRSSPLLKPQQSHLPLTSTSHICQQPQGSSGWGEGEGEEILPIPEGNFKINALRTQQQANCRLRKSV